MLWPRVTMPLYQVPATRSRCAGRVAGAHQMLSGACREASPGEGEGQGQGAGLRGQAQQGCEELLTSKAPGGSMGFAETIVLFADVAGFCRCKNLLF